MKIVPSIPLVYPGTVPSEYVNDVRGWSFPMTLLETNRGKLLTLDIDFGEYCSLSCPWCFRKNGSVDSSGRPVLSYEETIEMVRQAKDLGLKTVKFLGAGEPFENSRFLHLLRDLNELGIYASIFTKGHVLGSNELTSKYFGKSENIRTADELVKVVSELDVSILLSFQSFDDGLQDSLVNVSGYTALRNRAIDLLCYNGMNQPNPTRLALAVLPITKITIKEAFEIYCWARERNMYPCVCPSMCSGRANDKEYRDFITPSEEELIELYTKIYEYNISKGIQTLERIRNEGIASYAGGAPCVQIACGMYVTSRGIVLRCPGDDVTIFGDVREQSLANIWHQCENHGRDCHHCKCPPKDGKTIPSGLYEKVLVKISK